MNGPYGDVIDKILDPNAFAVHNFLPEASIQLIQLKTLNDYILQI